MSGENLQPRPRPPVRWWPLAAVFVLAVGITIWIWGWHGTSRQEKILSAAYVIIGSSFAGGLWLMLLSRLRWRARFGWLFAALAVLAAIAFLVRIRGVSGDLAPILEWRWTARAPAMELPASSVPTNAPAASGETALNTGRGYPQFLGPDRNSIVPELPLELDWTAHPPELLWHRKVSPAWSGFAILGQRAVTQEQRGEEEAVVCYDLLTGQELWAHRDTARYNTVIAGDGPRATPTISSNRVYTVGGTGILNCLNLTNGAVLWSTNFITSNGSKVEDWGVSCSPLLADNLVIVNPGGREGKSLAAYDAISGALVWTGGNDAASYSSAIRATLASLDQVLIFNAKELTAHDLRTGEALWRFPWPATHPHVAAPLVLEGDRVLISSGYGTGSALLQITRGETWSVKQLWKSNRLKAKFANLVLWDGHVYAMDDGILACLKADSGELKWKEGRYGHGQIILTGDLLLIMAESGDVAVADASPEGLRERARFSVFQDKTWNPPALAGEYLLVRNDKEAACFRLPLRR